MRTRTETFTRSNAVMGAALVAVWAGGLFSWPALAQTNIPQPALSLSFENGLTPETGPTNALAWEAQEKPVPPPQYDEQGVTGKALRITESRWAFGFRIPQQERKRGTLLLWVKDPQGPGGGILGSWGPGWANIGSDGLQTDVLLTRIGFEGVSGSSAQWTQYGISWQNEGAGRICLYANGKRAQDVPGVFGSSTMVIGAWAIPPGHTRLIDNVRLWDRVLTDSEVKQVFNQDSRLLNQPVVSVPRLRKAPDLDGKISPEEWTGAARITGLLEAPSGELAPDQSAFYLGYDDKFLYVAMNGEMTEKARDNPALVYERFLRAEGNGHDAKVDADDAVELVLAPDYWKTDDHRAPGPWKEYRVRGNAVGADSAATCGAAGTNPSWAPAWQSASTVSSKGWQFEARLPLDAFGGAAPAPGDRWAMQLGRVWKQLKDEYDVWAWGCRLTNDTLQSTYQQQTSGFPLANVGVLRFAGTNEPVVRVEKIGKLSEKNLDFQATLLNPSAAAQPVVLKLFTDTADCGYVATNTLPAGGEVRFAKQQRLTDFAASRLTFEVCTTNGAAIHRTEIPFHIEQKFGVRIAQFPNYEKFLAELDLGTLSSVPIAELSVDLQVRNAAGKTVYKQLNQRVADYLANLHGTTKGFDLGTYSLSVTVRRGEKVLAGEQVPFTKIEKAVWFDKRYGDDDVDQDQVPYPWTEMKVRDQRSAVSGQQSAHSSICVWGREYQFGTSLLPEQVTTLDRPLLRAPMRLIVKTADGTVLDSSQVKARAKWTKTRKTRVEGTRTLTAKGFSLSNKVWADYDGLVWNTITLTPRKKVSIASLEIEIPLTKEFTDVSFGTWLGNGDGGLDIFEEGNRLFVDSKKPVRVDPVRVDKKDGAATWRMVLVDVPTEFDKPYAITLGFMATPAKPKIWRTAAFDPRSINAPGGWFPKGLEFKPAADTGADTYGGGGGGPLYVHTTPVNPVVDASGTDDSKLYGAEWFKDPFSSRWNMTDVASKSFQDYFVWRYWRYQQKYGLGGYYYDNPHRQGLDTRAVIKRMYAMAMLDRHFAPWIRPIVGASNGYLDLRYMSFWNAHLDGEQFNGCIQQWQTYIGHIFPADFRAEFMGHNLGWPVYFLGQGRLTPEWVNAHGGAEANADYIQGLNLLHDAKPGGWHFQGANEQACQRAADAFDKQGMTNWVYQFLPYWHQDIVALPSTNMYASFYIARPSQLAAADPEAIDAYFEQYQTRLLPEPIRLRNRHAVEQSRKALEGMKDKVAMVVYNDSAWEGVLRLKPDWKKIGLGLPVDLSATNAVHSTGFRLEMGKDKDGKEMEKAAFFNRPEEYARIDGEELVFPMTKWNYRMIVLEKK